MKTPNLVGSLHDQYRDRLGAYSSQPPSFLFLSLKTQIWGEFGTKPLYTHPCLGSNRVFCKERLAWLTLSGETFSSVHSQRPVNSVPVTYMSANSTCQWESYTEMASIRGTIHIAVKILYTYSSNVFPHCHLYKSIKPPPTFLVPPFPCNIEIFFQTVVQNKHADWISI